MRLPRRRYRAVVFRMLAPPPDTSREEYKRDWRWLASTAHRDLIRTLMFHQRMGVAQWNGYVEERK